MKRLTGLSMALNSPAGEQSGMGAPGDPGNPLCSLIRATPEGRRRCRECDLQHHRHAAAAGRPIVYTCHAGFYDMAVPITVGGRLVATISSGQVLPERPSPAGLRRLRLRLHSYRVPDRTLAAAYRRAPWMDREQLQQVTRLLELFAAQIGEGGLLAHETATRIGHGDLHRVRQLIDERFADRAFGLTEAASAVGLSPAHFSHRFHRLFGATFVHAVQGRRVCEAQRLLATTDRRITAIALATGFDNPTHFNRVFRRIAGCTPTAWRRQRPDRDTTPLKVPDAAVHQVGVAGALAPDGRVRGPGPRVESERASATGRRGVVGGYNGRSPSAHDFAGPAGEIEPRQSPRGS